MGIVGLGVSVAVMYAVVEGGNLHYLLAKICAAGCTFGVNFALRRLLLFTHWGHEHSHPGYRDVNA